MPSIAVMSTTWLSVRVQLEPSSATYPQWDPGQMALPSEDEAFPTVIWEKGDKVTSISLHHCEYLMKEGCKTFTRCQRLVRAQEIVASKARNSSTERQCPATKE